MVDIQARLGDNDTAHALAFGMCKFELTSPPAITNRYLADSGQGG